MTAPRTVAKPKRAKSKPEPIYLRVTDDGRFEPASALYSQMLRDKKYRRGDLVRAVLTKTRYPKHHRLVMALLNKVLDNQEGVLTFKQLLTIVKIRLGYVETVVDASSGKVYYIPESIAFDAMDQGRFSVFWKDLCALVRRDYFPHLDDDQVAELAEMLDDP